MNNAFLKTEGLYKGYKTPEGKLEIIKGIDLSLEQGGLYFVVGKSGSGKSTLLHMLGGLDYPTAGHVYLEGKDIYRLREKEIANYRNQAFGFVFQFFHLLFVRSIFDSAMPLPAAGMNSNFFCTMIDSDRVCIRFDGKRFTDGPWGRCIGIAVEADGKVFVYL